MTLSSGHFAPFENLYTHILAGQPDNPGQTMWYRSIRGDGINAEECPTTRWGVPSQGLN